MKRPASLFELCIMTLGVLSLVAGSHGEPPDAHAPRLPAGVADPDAKTIFVANHAGGVEALELSTGKLKWTAPGPMSPVWATQDRVLAAVVAPDFKQFTLATLDPATGKRVRVSAPLKLPDITAAAGSEMKVDVIVHPESPDFVIAYWELVATDEKGRFSRKGRARVNLNTGLVESAPREQDQATWTSAFERPFPVVTLADRKLQVIETADGEQRSKRTLRATDRATGTTAWEHALGSVTGKSRVRAIRFLGGGVASADGTIGFVPRTSDDGGIDAFDLRSGQSLWQTVGREQPLLAIDGALLAADWRKGGTELVLVWIDPATGKRLRESDVQPLLPPPALPSFWADASLCAADGQLLVGWTVHTRQRFGAAGLAESMTVSGSFRLALETGKVSDAKSAHGRFGPPLTGELGPGEIDRRELNGLKLSIQSRQEPKPHAIVFHDTLRATDPAGKVAWEHPLAPREQSTLPPPPRAAGGR